MGRWSNPCERTISVQSSFFSCAARIALPPQLLRRLWAYVMTLCLEASLSIRKASVDGWLKTLRRKHEEKLGGGVDAFWHVFFWRERWLMGDYCKTKKSKYFYIFAGAEFIYVHNYVNSQLSESGQFNWTTLRVPVWKDGGWESISVKLRDSATSGGDKSTFSVLVLDLSCFFGILKVWF